MTTTANIATYPPRAKALRKMLESIKGQFDVVRICLNGYDSIPEDLAGYECHIPETDLKSAGKFHWLSKTTFDEMYFTLDDDLIYPPDYATRMLAHLKFAPVVTAHGHTITAMGQNWHEGHLLHCFDRLTKAQHVHVGGDGCMAVHGGDMWKDLSPIDPDSSDAFFALHCAEYDIPVLMLAHNENWITQQPDPGGVALSTSTRGNERLTAISDMIFTIYQEKGLAPVKKKICYTIITNGYDLLRQPEHVTPGWEYIVLTDNKERMMQAGGLGIWQVMDIALIAQRIYVDTAIPQSEQRVAKALPAFGDNVRSVYVDANMVITGDLDVLVMETHHPGVITSKQHPGRNCVYDELEAISQLQKETSLRAARWQLTLEAIGRTKNAGLSETGILIRDHSDDPLAAINKSAQLWCMLMHTYSWRDQLSFDLVAGMFGVSNRQPADVFDRFVKWTPHSSLAAANKADKQEPDPAAPAMKIETVAASANAQKETQPTLGIVTCSTEDTMGIVPLFVMAALDHNPDAFVTVLIPPGSAVPDMDPVLERHGIMNYILAPVQLMDGRMADPAAAPFLFQPPVPTDLLFCCPITHMVLTDLRAAYMPIMEREKAAYINMQDEWPTRLGPIHFTRWEALHPHPLVQQRGHNLFLPVGNTLARIVSMTTGQPLKFTQVPITGYDPIKKTGASHLWKKYIDTESFIAAVTDLSQEGVMMLKS